MWIRLTRKLADAIDGIDLSSHGVGDIVNLSPREAQLLVAEGWGVRTVAHANRHRSAARPKALAADRATRRRR